MLPWGLIIIFVIGGHGAFKMSSKEARDLLKRIGDNPGLADQFTEEEIEKLEELAKKS